MVPVSSLKSTEPLPTNDGENDEEFFPVWRDRVDNGPVDLFRIRHVCNAVRLSRIVEGKLKATKPEQSLFEPASHLCSLGSAQLSFPLLALRFPYKAP